MAHKGTNNMNDYINDYERAMQDYNDMGPLWAEMVFGDDFEAMKAMYGRSGKQPDNGHSKSSAQEHDSRSVKRR